LAESSSSSFITDSVTWTPPHRKPTLVNRKTPFSPSQFLNLDSIPFNSSLRKKQHIVISLLFFSTKKIEENAKKIHSCYFSLFCRKRFDNSFFQFSRKMIRNFLYLILNLVVFSSIFISQSLALTRSPEGNSLNLYSFSSLVM
jgi:hypothetical protein